MLPSCFVLIYLYTSVWTIEFGNSIAPSESQSHNIVND